MPSASEAAAAALAATHASVLGALDALGLEARGAAATRVTAHRAAREHALVVARNTAAQRVTEMRLRARDAARLLTAPEDGPLAVADHVSLGEVRLSGRDAGVNEEIVAPLVVPLIGSANLIVHAAPDAALPVVRRAMLEALRRTAPGQLDVVAYDPAMSGALAPFAAIRAAAPESLRVVSGRTEFAVVLDELTAEVHRTTEMMRGQSPDLLSFRRREDSPVGRLVLVVLLEDPTGSDEDAARRLATLMAVGPAAGVTFVVATEDDRDDRADPTLRAVEGGMVWEAAPGWRVEVPPVPIATITAEADALAARITAASVPAVPFTRVQPLDAPWATSSAERITFAVGAEGSRTVEVTLGDAVDQRHNVLVTGAVGQGKSNLLSVVVHSLAARYSPDELELHLLDFKEGVTLYPLAPTPGSPDFLPHARVLGLESDREFGVAALEHVEAEFARRARLFRPHGDSIAAYRRTVPDAVMPRIVVVVDEFHMLFDPADETADRGARVLEAIARRGRSYGVHLVLASQTVAGISALMTRENGIFAQFPIRIALKNALTESFASLAPGNDGAARLRARGTAILNLDYGEVTANRTVVIAAADAEELAGARRAWWAHSGRREHPPLVFDGSRRWRPVDAIGVIRDLRAAVIGGRATPAAVVGMPVAVGGPPASVPLSREPGRHLAVLGAGEDTRNADEDTANVAVGVLQTAALSLAMQHPRGDAEFVAVDLLDDEGRRRADQDGWLALMARLGFPVRTVGRSDLAAFLAETASVVRDRAEVDDAPSLYVVGFALDRAVGLDVPDAFANRPVEAFQDLLVSGPAVGVHVLGWWTNVATWKAHIGLMNEGSIDGLLLLRLDRSATADAVGPLVPWTVRDNRGLLLDSTQRPEPTVIVPSSPLAAGQAAAFAATDWGTT